MDVEEASSTSPVRSIRPVGVVIVKRDLGVDDIAFQPGLDDCYKRRGAATSAQDVVLDEGYLPSVGASDVGNH